MLDTPMPSVSRFLLPIFCLLSLILMSSELICACTNEADPRRFRAT